MCVCVCVFGFFFKNGFGNTTTYGAKKLNKYLPLGTEISDPFPEFPYVPLKLWESLIVGGPEIAGRINTVGGWTGG
jgi:hypothetical protein